MANAVDKGTDAAHKEALGEKKEDPPLVVQGGWILKGGGPPPWLFKGVGF